MGEVSSVGRKYIWYIHGIKHKALREDNFLFIFFQPMNFNPSLTNYGLTGDCLMNDIIIGFYFYNHN